MKAVLAFALLLLGARSSLAAPYYDITDPFMAEYEGIWTASSGAKGRLTAQIRPLSNNRYDGFILFVRAKSPVTAFQLTPATEEKGLLKFSGATIDNATDDLFSNNQINAELRDAKFTGSFKGDLGEGTFEARKIERKPPSLGAKPPKHSIVLSDPDNTNAWQKLSWPLSPEGVLRVSRGNLLSKDKLNNFRLHIEFRTPYMPTEEGQKRGNSGVYLQGKYEVQVLDSFGLYPLQDNDCAGIYKVKAPSGNACLPPMQWQTYDITYIDGTASRPPRITVEHNGFKIIDRAEVPISLVEKGTGGGDLTSGFLMLQDHGNPVEFRNIWALPFFSTERTR